MFTIIEEDMKDFKRQDKYSDFEPLEDIEVLAMQENRCMIRTGKLMPTLWFMQDAGWKIYEITPDDEYVVGMRFVRDILTYYKPKSK
jgi:hypothetical protein